VTDDELFLVTVDELDERLQLRERQLDALSLALPLRKLLVEGTIVANVANPRRLRIRYRISGVSPPEEGDWEPNETLYPGDEGEDAELDRKAFLHRPVMVVFGETIQVKDLIAFVANYAGVVHKKRPDTHKMEVLWDHNWGARVTTPAGQFSGAAYALLPVARIVLDALTPLRDQVARDAQHLPGKPRGLSRPRDPRQRDG
jgi:hypothetical protein